MAPGCGGAAKQCGQNWLPRWMRQSRSKIFSEFDRYEARSLLAQGDARSFKQVLHDFANNTAPTHPP